MRTGVIAIAASLLVAACGDDGNSVTGDGGASDGSTDGTVDALGNVMPTTLAETGLCDDPACAVVNPNIIKYVPRYELFADNATKRRWIQLPPGTKIDTSDMNYWKFPVGTKVWKEFTRGEHRVETRFMYKVGSDDSLQASWYWASFVWDTTATSSTLYDAAEGNTDVAGTGHDVPSRTECRRCHQNTPGRVLGVNAMSLDYAAPDGYADLQDLIAMDLLSAPPTNPVAGTYFPLPGNDDDKRAFGYLHGNCSGCHNPTSSIYATTPLDVRIDVTKRATVQMMPAYATTVNVDAVLSSFPGKLIIPNDTNGSVLLQRMGSMTPGIKMPEIGSELRDESGYSAIATWINNSL